VQNRLNGKSSPHKALNPDFPLRGFVRCASCNKKLTAGWAKGRAERYARYWCWTKGCHAVGIAKDELEQHWVSLLASMEPTTELLAQLPEIAARGWQARKARIGKDVGTLSKRLADQSTLNQKLIMAKLNGEISQEDFQTMKTSITTETEKIKEQITALDSERSTMTELMQQASVQLLDLVSAWRNADVNQKQELANSLFEGGLVFGHKRGFFEPANVAVTDLFRGFLEQIASGQYVDSEFGRGERI
jgi:site-specific DNA recombinase